MKNSEKNLNWAIAGTGAIANEMAQTFRNMGRNIYAVSNRTYSKAIQFAAEYGIRKVYEDVSEMLSDGEVDIVYIATPHNSHVELILKALENGKHVLCEKSITLNSTELSQAADLAKDKGLVLAEGMTIYHMPVYKKLYEMVSSGVLGELRMIQLSFGSYKEYDMANRFFNKELAGGALLDIGVYALSFASLFMSAKPDQIVSQVKLAESGADEQSGILMTNRDGEMAVISLSLHSKQPKRGILSCDRGYVEVMEYPRAEEAVIVYTGSGEREVIALGEKENALRYEAEDMEEAVLGGQNDMRLQNSMDVSVLMTDIRRAWGLYYDSELK